jgi:hypothetical protein
MQVTIERVEREDWLIVRIPVKTPPVLSASGKTLLVASSHGNVTTTAILGGKPVVIGFNAYVSAK